jgi:hypothetical protein
MKLEFEIKNAELRMKKLRDGGANFPGGWTAFVQVSMGEWSEMNAECRMQN